MKKEVRYVVTDVLKSTARGKIFKELNVLRKQISESKYPEEVFRSKCPLVKDIQMSKLKDIAEEITNELVDQINSFGYSYYNTAKLVLALALVDESKLGNLKMIPKTEYCIKILERTQKIASRSELAAIMEDLRLLS